MKSSQSPTEHSSTSMLVIGSKGMLARDLLSRWAQTGLHAHELDLPELDITKLDHVASALEALAPGLVVNCAAYTAVDKAESEPDLAYGVNRDGPANLADCCESLEIPLIHISTDYVFDGSAKVPYKETDPVNPLSVYGRSKWEGEERVRTRLKEHVIVRTAWLYGVHGHNFVKTILALARERDEIKVVADQYGGPTWTGDLARVLVEVARAAMQRRREDIWGTYHFCGAGVTTWHGFAEAIVDKARERERLRVARVIPITTREYPTPAHRPAWSVLDCHEMGRVFGITPPAWQSGLDEMMEELHTR